MPPNPSGYCTACATRSLHDLASLYRAGALKLPAHHSITCRGPRIVPREAFARARAELLVHGADARTRRAGNWRAVAGTPLPGLAGHPRDAPPVDADRRKDPPRLEIG